MVFRFLRYLFLLFFCSLSATRPNHHLLGPALYSFFTKFPHSSRQFLESLCTLPSPSSIFSIVQFSPPLGFSFRSCVCGFLSCVTSSSGAPFSRRSPPPATAPRKRVQIFGVVCCRHWLKLLSPGLTSAFPAAARPQPSPTMSPSCFAGHPSTSGEKLFSPAALRISWPYLHFSHSTTNANFLPPASFSLPPHHPSASQFFFEPAVVPLPMTYVY